MSRQNGTRVLVEKIEDAIEQAEDLGLAFCCRDIDDGASGSHANRFDDYTGRADERRR
jgi:hypothetical protein